MTQHRSANLDDDIARDFFYEMRSPYCFLTPPQLNNGGNIYTSTFTLFLGEMAGKSKIAFIIVIRFVPGCSLCRKTNKMTCAHSEDLDQTGHSENGENLDLNIYIVHEKKIAEKSRITFIRFVM